MKTKSLLFIAMALILILNACAPSTLAPVSNAANYQAVAVDHVEVEVGVGSPIPVEIVASGTWPDRCAQITEVRSEKQGFQIDVTILASTVSSCPPDLLGAPFRYALPLNIVEMPAGKYTITVNDVSTIFDWRVEPEESTGSISGWVWHDRCETGFDGEPALTSTPPGCIEQASPLGAYHANGALETDELPIEGIVVKLRQGDCSATSLTEIEAEMATLASDLSYSFTDLTAGTYCVSIDPQAEPNFSLLRPGLWTYPFVTEGIIDETVTLRPGENKFDVNFGWDHQFK